MKGEKILLLVILAVLVTNGQAQSAYTFSYNFRNAPDSITYNGFLMRNGDGSGLLRIRYKANGTSEDNLVEAFIAEQTPFDNKGEPDTNLLVIKLINPSFIQTDNQSKFNPPDIIFRYNAINGFFEPSGVTYTTGKEIPSKFFFKWNLLEESALSKEVVSQFFSEDDDFYNNLFRPVTRGLSAAEKNIRMHLLIVADTVDKEIGISTALDIKRITELFNSICQYLGIKMLSTVITGKSFGKTGVQTAITNLRPLSSDIVIFYYSGHGFRIPEKPRNYPNLKLKNVKTLRANFRDSIAWARGSREANISQSMNIQDIFNTITKKGARMNLVISDCCNDDIFSVNAKGTKPSGTKSSGVQWNEENIRSLFLNKNPMSVLVTAAAEGERAASEDNFGGFFTYYLKTSLEAHCSKLKSNVSWDQVLQQAKTQTITKAKGTYCDKPKIPQNLCKQNPVYTIVSGK